MVLGIECCYSEARAGFVRDWPPRAAHGTGTPAMVRKYFQLPGTEPAEASCRTMSMTLRMTAPRMRPDHRTMITTHGDLLARHEAGPDLQDASMDPSAPLEGSALRRVATAPAGTAR